jgi:cytochrome c biogenesis protein CcdA
MTDAIRSALPAGHFAALPLMLLRGLIAGLNPCCLALYPAAAATCCGVRGQGTKQAFSAALAFTTGLALATSTLGMMAAWGGRLFSVARPFRYAIAAVPLLMGLHLLGFLKLPLPDLASRMIRRRIGTAFSTGFLFSLVIGPCSTPVFASVLSCAAYGQNAAYGGVLLFVYGLGAGIPILLSGAAIGRFAQRLERAGFGAWINRAVGVSILLLGFYLFWIA